MTAPVTRSMNGLALHRGKLLLLGFLALVATALLAGAGSGKPLAAWHAFDIVGEGGSALLVLVWAVLLLKSRPRGHVTSLLFAGLACLFLALWVDTLDEFLALPPTVHWDGWLESIPMPLGFGMLTLGIYHLHREQLALRLHLAKREKHVRDYREFDPLIALGDAHYLRRQLAAALAAAGPEQPLSATLIDLVDFAAVNRRHGPAEGDRALQAVAQCLLLSLRDDDLLCRLAGDRFVILWPATGLDAAQAMATECSASLRHLACRSRQGARMALDARSASVQARPGEAVQALLERLQDRLALAKAPASPWSHGPVVTGLR